MEKKNEEQNLKEENQILQQQLSLSQSLQQLQNESYFRLQLLMSLEKITDQLSAIAMLTKDLSQELPQESKEENKKVKG